MKTLPRALLETPSGLTLPKSIGGFVVADTEAGLALLRSAIAGGAKGIALAGASTGADIQRLSALLSVAEAEEARAEGITPVIVVTDGILPSPASREGFSNKSARLAGLVWDHRLLQRRLGVTRALNDSDRWSDAFAAARAAVLLAAAAARIPSYDTVMDLADAGFAADCRRSRTDGFFGRVAIDDAQSAVIDSLYGRKERPAPEAAGGRPA